LSVKLEHRQQLDGSDAELLEVWNLLDESGERASLLFRDVGTRVTRETPHVHLVDNRPGPWPLQGHVSFPIVCMWIYDHALHRRRGVIALLTRGIPTVVAGDNRSTPVWVQKYLAGIKPHSP
jgi:hypothetical protein